MNKKELAAYVQRVINEQYAGLQAAFAQDKKISTQYVNDVLHDRREPGKKILDAIGVERVTTYRLKKR